MLKQIYKIIKDSAGDKAGTIYGSNRDIRTFDAVPEWFRESGDSEIAFNYRGRRYFLGEFSAISPQAPDWMDEFDGYAADSFFSGVLIKIGSDGETVRAFTYIV
jgi:hypothetical protein